MVKFPMDRPVKIVMLGAGGTGGYVAPYLFRLLHMLDKADGIFRCDNMVYDDAVDVPECCRRAEELFELYQRCANRKQIETICTNYLRALEATKLSITGHMYFVPHTYMDQVDIFEDFILLLSGLNKKATPLVVNSFYMIRDILNASRLQTQGNNEPCSNFSLSALLTELCEPYRLIAEAKGVKFKIELSSDAFVYLPEGQLKKAISNILSNAVNYTEAGQSILVVFDKNKISVSNECSVLPPEQLQHIFEPFYRPDLAHSQATGGNGLGLYIVQTILDKLRLKYQFVPMPNDRGMNFTIQF